MVGFFVIGFITIVQLGIILYICARANLFSTYKNTKLSPQIYDNNIKEKSGDNESDENNYLFIMV